MMCSWFDFPYRLFFLPLNPYNDQQKQRSRPFSAWWVFMGNNRFNESCFSLMTFSDIKAPQEYSLVTAQLSFNELIKYRIVERCFLRTVSSCCGLSLCNGLHVAPFDIREMESFLYRGWARIVLSKQAVTVSLHETDLILLSFKIILQLKGDI